MFAARPAQDLLLGIYALTAEFRGLTEPGIDIAVAERKLMWWREELARLAAGMPLHPITRFVAAAAHPGKADFGQLDTTLEAVARDVAGAPLERAADLLPHADALYGAPLRAAARLGEGGGDAGGDHKLEVCTGALAAGEYLLRAIAGYGLEARLGRVVFAVDDLLAAGIDNDDLAAPAPSGRLREYLELLRGRAGQHFAAASDTLAPRERPRLRHLQVLAALGVARAKRRRPDADFRLGDLYNAWTAARRAARAR